nr:ribonuclease H-like domain-containing protein [Tanacetum cinerariifolium]
MESLSSQVVSAAKIPIFNPNEFDLWKNKIEQYFLMTDYSLWEVILNGDSSIPTRVIDGVVQPVAPTTAEHRFGGNMETKKVQKTLLKQLYENFTSSSSKSLDQLHDRLQKLVSELEILIESLSQEDINLKFLRSLPTEWRTHILIWRYKIDLEDQSLHDLFNSLKIYEAEVKSSSTTSPSTQNIAFVSSQTLTALMINLTVHSFDNDDLKQIDADDLEEMDLKWQMAMLTIRAMSFLQRTGRNLRANGTTSIAFDMLKVECYNCHRRGNFAREYRSPKYNRNKETQRRNVPVETSMSNALVLQYDGVGIYDWSFLAEEEPTNYALMAFTSSSSSSSDNEVASYSKTCTKAYATLQSHYNKLTNDLRKSQFDVIPYKIGLESVEARILVYQQNETVFKEDIKLLKLDVQLRDNALVEFRKKFKKAEQDRDELKLKLDKFQTFSKNLIYDRYKSGEGYHVVPPFYTGTFMPPKPDFGFHIAPTVNETVPTAFIVEPKDVSEGKPMTAQKAPSFVQTIKHVKTPRPSVKTFKHPILASNLQTDILKSRGHENNRNRKACFVCKSLTHLIKDCNYYEKMVQKHVRNHAMRGNHQNYVRMTHPNLQRHGNPQHDLKDKGVINNGCSRHMTGNMSYLSDFKEINGGYVALVEIQRVERSQMCNKKNSVLFTDTECIILSFDFKLPDENHVLFRVPRENNMYSVDLKNIVPSGDLTYLFAKATLDEYNLWHRRLGHINFKIINKLVKDNLVRGLPSKVFKNNHTCVACKKGKQHIASYPLGKFDGKTDEGFLIGYFVSRSGPTWLFDIDTLTKSMNYQPVIAGNQPNPNPQNTDDDVTFEVKEPEFKVKEPESEVHASLRNSAKIKKHDDKTKERLKARVISSCQHDLEI